MENKDTRDINKYPIKFVRKIPQEQTVYLESKHSIDDIIDWFENVGLPTEEPHRNYRNNNDRDPISVDLLRNELTEEGWKSSDERVMSNVGLKPSFQDSYLSEWNFVTVNSTEVFDGKYDQQIDEYLREKPKKERKGFLKDQRRTLKGLNHEIEEVRSRVITQMEHMSEGLSTDGGSIRRDGGLRPSLKESYLDEYYFESVPSTEGFDGKYDQQIDEYLREKPKKERKGFLKNQRNTLRGLNSDIEELRSNVLRQMEYMSEGLSTDDYSQMDKTEKKLVDDFYKISPYLNPLELKNYNS